jgi:hypothetical protein
MKKLTLILCSVAILSACSGIDKQPGPSAYGPINQDAQAGEASYTVGSSSVMRSRREDTYKKMYDACGGPYKIMSENNDGQTVHMKFVCANQ